MTELSMQQQQVRLGLRLSALAATPAGTTNTGVANWVTTSAAQPASQYPNANWVTVTSTAAAGTEFKFTRKGIYKFDVTVPHTAAEVGPLMIAGSLNAPSLLAAGVTPALALVNFEDYDLSTQIAAMQNTLKLHFTVHITAAGRSSATYATTAPVGTSALGTARIHLGDGAGGAAAAVTINVESAMLRLSDLAEIFG